MKTDFRQCRALDAMRSSIVSGCGLCFSGDALKLQREVSIDQRSASIHIDELARDPACLPGTDQSDGIADVRRSAQASHRSPSALLPDAQTILERFRQAVENAVFNPARTNGIHSNTSRGQRDGKI